MIRQPYDEGTTMSASARKLNPTEYQGNEASVDDSRVLMTGMNLEMRLSESDDDANSSLVSLWKVVFSPSGPGHALYIKSELTENRWRIYSDNLGLARWLQQTVQGVLRA